MLRISTRVRLAPLLIAQVYLTTTVLIFAFGPWPWPVAHPFELYSYLALGQLAVLTGYLSGAWGPPRAYHTGPSPSRLVASSVALNLLLIGPTIALRTGNELSILEALRNPGLAYLQAKDAASGGKTALEIIRMFCGPLTVLLVPLTVAYWETLSRRVRVGALMAIATNSVMWAVLGTNKGLADLLILGPWLMLLRVARGLFHLSRRRVFLATGLLFTAVVLFASFFERGQRERQNGFEVPNFFPGAAIYADNDGPILRRLSPTAQGAARGLALYIGQGYYGLSLAQQKDFVPTYGLGHSIFLQIVVKRFTGSDVAAERSLPGRIDSEDGWDRYGFWHSIYPWFASDVGWAGALVVMFLLSRLFALAWVDAVGGRHPLAVALFGLSAITVMYVSANNQNLQYAEGFSAFYVLVSWWLLTRAQWTVVRRSLTSSADGDNPSAVDATPTLR